MEDGLCEKVAVFVLQTDFYGALGAMLNESGDATEEHGAAGDGFAVMLPIKEPDVEVPPVVNQRDEIGHDPAGSQALGGEAIPAPLVFEFIVNLKT